MGTDEVTRLHNKISFKNVALHLCSLAFLASGIECMLTDNDLNRQADELASIFSQNEKTKTIVEKIEKIKSKRHSAGCMIYFCLSAGAFIAAGVREKD